MDILTVLRAGEVERFHSVPGITKQRVSEHSSNVALICQHLEPECSKELILAALTHDSAEMVTGDIPATFKWKNELIAGEIKSAEASIEKQLGIDFYLSAAEKRTLKLADCFDGMWYCIRRRAMGEVSAFGPYQQWVGYVNTKLKPDGKEWTLFDKLRHMMGEVNNGRK